MRPLLPVLACCILLVLAGCGQRGPLELSAEQKARVEAEKAASAASEARAPGESPRKPFPLDRLL